LEWAYSQAPALLRASVMGLFLLASGLGSVLGSGLLQAALAVGWLSPHHLGNINDSRLHLYFFTLAAVQAATLLAFAVFIVRPYAQRTKRATLATRGAWGG
uniref:Solute carrier family 15 member 4-like n=1 Tax=Petromyzon marinus TaxID=7757 RepID=A0AAJ7WKZ3_PETMA